MACFMRYGTYRKFLDSKCDFKFIVIGANR